MPTKEVILSQIENSDKTSYKKGEVKNLVYSVSNDIHANRPNKLKKGDVVKLPIGTKVRPCVIFKIVNSLVYSIPLSTTDNHLSLMPSSSRFMGEGFFSRHFVVTSYEFALEEYICTYDNNRALNKAIIELKEEIDFVFK